MGKQLITYETVRGKDWVLIKTGRVQRKYDFSADLEEAIGIHRPNYRPQQYYGAKIITDPSAINTTVQPCEVGVKFGELISS